MLIKGTTIRPFPYSISAMIRFGSLGYNLWETQSTTKSSSSRTIAPIRTVSRSGSTIARNVNSRPRSATRIFSTTLRVPSVRRHNEFPLRQFRAAPTVQPLRRVLPVAPPRVSCCLTNVLRRQIFCTEHILTICQPEINQNPAHLITPSTYPSHWAEWCQTPCKSPK